MYDNEVKEELAEIDAKIEEYKTQVELGEAIERLHENEDFKLLILEGYFKTEAERVFELLTNPTGFKRDQLETINDKLGSIRDLKEFFMMKLREADAAFNGIEESNQYRQEVTARPIITDAELVE